MDPPTSEEVNGIARVVCPFDEASDLEAVIRSCVDTTDELGAVRIAHYICNHNDVMLYHRGITNIAIEMILGPRGDCVSAWIPSKMKLAIQERNKAARALLLAAASIQERNTEILQRFYA